MIANPHILTKDLQKRVDPLTPSIKKDFQKSWSIDSLSIKIKLVTRVGQLNITLKKTEDQPIDP